MSYLPLDFVINCSKKAKELGAVFEIKNSEQKEQLSKYIRELDERCGFKLEEGDCLNNYNNDDYIMLSYLINSIRDIHKKTYYDPINHCWLNGNREIPYIHLTFVQEPCFELDNEGNPIIDDEGNYITNDRALNIGVKPPRDNGTHIIKFNHYWLIQYIDFLQKIFDDNEELITTLPSDFSKTFQNEYVSKEELYKMAADIETCGAVSQANLLRIYAEGAYDKRRIKKPFLTFFEDNNGQQKTVVWAFYDEKRNVFSIPLKKGIYNTSGFAHLFHERNQFVMDLFTKTIKFILGHEIAHVARGHWLLRKNEPKFSMQRNVKMNCELNADWTSSHWLLDDLLFHTASGHPQDLKLAYSKDRLEYQWSLCIFSMYLSLSWVYRDSREWTDETITLFRQDMNADHPIYHFRLYNSLFKMKNHIDNDYINKKHDYAIKSIDGYELKEIAKNVWENAYDMILSFEAAFRISWDKDERDSLQKMKDSLIVHNSGIIENERKIPFMMAYMEQSQKELAEYEILWKVIYEKLKKYKAYYIS